MPSSSPKKSSPKKSSKKKAKQQPPGGLGLEDQQPSVVAANDDRAYIRQTSNNSERVTFVDDDDDVYRPSSSSPRRHVVDDDDDDVNRPSSKRNNSERRPSTGLTSSKPNNNTNETTSGNNKRSYKSKNSKSYVDPTGFTTKEKDLDLLYQNEELNPLNASSTATQNGNGKDNQTTATDPLDDNNDDDDDDADEELLDDTFTFLMTGKYPLEDCLCGKNTNNGNESEDVNEQSMNNGGDDALLEGEGEGIEEMEPLDNMSKSTTRTRSTKNIALKDVEDPDALCLPFWLGFFVIISQLFIYAIVLANVLRDPVPPNADIVLRLAQIFAVFVTLYTQSDFIDGIFLMTESWKSFKDITGPIKFKLSALCRILAGNVGILSTFLLVMYSEEVVDLLLNFTAMEFVATLDDSAFELAAKGFLGGALERKGEIVRNFRYKARHSKKRRRLRFWLYVLYIGLVFGGFFIIVGLQRSRSVGVDNEVYIQVDDTGIKELYGVSGVYHGCTGFKSQQTGDIGYIDIGQICPNDKEDREKVKKEDKIIPARTFVYCHDLEGWVLGLKNTTTPCDKGEYLIRSFVDDPIPANAFDILSHSDATWLVARADVGNEAILDNVVVESIQEIPSNFKNCIGDGGLLRTDKAESLQRAFDPLPNSSYPTYTFKKKDQGCSEEVCPYNVAFGQMYRPVFVRKIHEAIQQANQEANQSTEDLRYQVIFYDSLRWNRIYLNPMLFASHINRDGDCGKNNDEDPDCFKIFVKYFHSADPSWRSNFTIAVFDGISDPMMLLSTSDTGVPTSDLKWYESILVGGRIVPGQPKAGFDPREVDGYISPIQQEVCPQVEDYWYYFEDVDGELDVETIADDQFLLLLYHLCTNGKNGVEKACSSLPDLDFGEDYSYAYDYYNDILGCGSAGELIGSWGFECEVSALLSCNKETQKELHINFVTDLYPFESSIMVYFGSGNETAAIVKNLEVAERTFALDRITEFTIPSNGLADLRFENANSAHLLSACVPISEPCVQVIMLDSVGDGITSTVGSGQYEIEFGNDSPIVGGGSDAFSCKVYNLGPSCGTKGGSEGGPGLGQAETFNCDYDAVMNSFPTNLIGGELPPEPKDKFDFLEVKTLPVTVEVFTTDPPVTLPPFSCDGNIIEMIFEVLTDSFPSETAFGVFIGQSLDDTGNLIDTETLRPEPGLEWSENGSGLSDEVLVLVKFHAELPSTTYNFGACVPADTQCVQVVVADTFNDGISPPGGYNITYGTDPPVRSVDAAADTDAEISWGCRHYQFGSGCINTLDAIPSLCSLQDFDDDILDKFYS